MTEGTQEPAPAAEIPSPEAAVEPSPPPALTPTKAEPPRPGAVRRVLNWFWRGRELKQLRREQKALSPRARQLAERARVLFELGERARRPAEPLPASGDAAAAELYRQSAFFGVRAVTLAQDEEATGTDAWSKLRPALREKLAADPEIGAELARLVESGTFVETWELADAQRALRGTQLAGAAQALLDELSWHTRARDALRIQRLVRITLLFSLIFGIIFGISWLGARSEQARDLAGGKAWRASSAMSGVGCTSPLQACGESTDFFFHTNDENGPWLEIDLGRRTKFSSVRVENRKDCCFDRAVPLVVEVSSDQKNFKEVARRSSSFSSWLASFAPTEARYVRLRVPRQTLLHLAKVRVLP